ncbi:MAG: hypothetical protein COB04_05215 [Gammaproteobacteria bacterium]|nr:MAG: hypothetical protein COB04_05215 [Gammaproteobacteria bacterium]
MKRLSLLDSLFLVMESKEQKMHVVVYFLFDKPSKCPKSYIPDLIDDIRLHPWPFPRIQEKLFRSIRTLSQYYWVPDNDIDMEHHVQHGQCGGTGSALDLKNHIAQYQAEPLDNTRPLWQIKVIEGVENDQQFAIVLKVHHCAVDGISAMNVFQELFKISPTDFSHPDMAAKKLKQLQIKKEREKNIAPTSLASKLKAFGLGIATILGNVIRGNSSMMAPIGAAPNTRFAQKVQASRSFGTVSISLPDVKEICAITGATINDVICALVGTAVQRYLESKGEYPDKNLYASIPMSLHTEENKDEANKLAICCFPLATHIPTMEEKIKTIIADTKRVKDEIKSLPQSALTIWLGVGFGIVGIKKLLRIPGLNPNGKTNVMISNVPSFKETRYYRGARLRGFYPLSLIMDGLGLNVTVISYADNLDFGLTSDQNMAPDIALIGDYMGEVMLEMNAQILGRGLKTG